MTYSTASVARRIFVRLMTNYSRRESSAITKRPLLKLLPPGSLAGKLKKISEKHNVFSVFGGLNAGAISMLGVLTLFFPVWAKLGADVAAMVGGLTAVRAVLRSACPSQARTQVKIIPTSAVIRIRRRGF